MNEVEIEVFRADDKASRGITSADIAATAAAYDPDNNPAHVCIGHPKSDTPAYGKIAALRAEGSRLFATLKDVKDKVVNGIKDGSLVNRSFAFFSRDHEANPVPGVLYPRHLGFLGAAAPGIPGLSNLKKALAFAADGETLEVDGDPAPAVVFDAAREPTPTFTMTEESKVATEQELEQRDADLKRREDEFAARIEAARKDGNKAVVDGLVASGKVLPADADRLTTIFNALDDEPLEFEAGKEKRSASAELAALLGGAVTLVDTSGKRKSPSEEFAADDKADAETIETKARGLMEKNPNLSFEAAVARVTGQDEE